MSIIRFTSGLAALATALVLATSVQAQLFKPFEFPEIESDFQFFAPADVDTFGGGPKGKTGWFATYSSLYMAVERPDDAYQLTNKYNDFTSGYRFDIGFVDDNLKGWLFTGWQISGPQQTDVQLIERTSRTVDGTPDNDPIFPRRDNNLRLTGDRDLLVYNSINVADLSGFELNRTWLMKPLHHGARLTVFGGFRYIKFVDFFQRDTYTRYDENGNPIPPLGLPILQADATAEELRSVQAGFTNEMVGGQLGIRWDKDYRRWNFSGDFKGFTFANFQSWNRVISTERTLGDIGDDPTMTLFEQTGVFAHSSQFVLGLEVRAEAAYRLTRDISLIGGFEFMDLARGVGRGNDPSNNDQSVTMYGATFGVTLNR